MMRDDRDEAMREAHKRGELLCLPVDWIPAVAVAVDRVLRPASPYELRPASTYAQSVRVYVPVVVIESRERYATVGPYLNSRPVAVPWHRLRLAMDAPAPDEDMLREVVARWPG